MSKPTKVEKNEEKVLARLREICLALPGVQEVKTWGHPTFQVSKKSFAVLDHYNDHLCICLKMTPALQALLLEDSRFFKTPYSGHRGWVSLIADQQPNWKEVRQLVGESYSLCLKKRKNEMVPRS